MNIFVNFAEMLQEGELDISPTCFTPTKARQTVVDFLPDLTEEILHLTLKNPADSYEWRAYVEELTPLCWGGIFIFGAIAPIVLAGILFYGKC